MSTETKIESAIESVIESAIKNETTADNGSVNMIRRCLVCKMEKPINEYNNYGSRKRRICGDG